MNEASFEKLLNIHTAGYQYGFPKQAHYHRYEPTPYEGLEQLFSQYELPAHAKCVDIGCGKGRVPIYLHYKFGVPTVGIEMDEKFFAEAEHNRAMYLQKAPKSNAPIEFSHMLGEQYEVQQADNVFFFFNPFSIEIFRKVLQNILRSYEQHVRPIYLILYYPSPEYMTYLQYETAFKITKEVALTGHKNINERLLVFELSY